MTNHGTNFESLSDDVLAEVVRKADHGEESPLQLFAPSSPFRRASPIVFQHLNVVIRGTLTCDPKIGYLTVDEYADMDKPSIHALEACGLGSFKSIDIAAEVEEEEYRDPTHCREPDGELGSFIAKFCRRGVKVIVAGIPEEAAEWAWELMLEVLNSVADRAGEVVFEGPTGKEYAAALSALRRRRFDGFVESLSTFPQLKILSYTGPNIRSLNRAWRYLGKSLEQIEITSEKEDHNDDVHDASHWAACINQLQLHCRKLASIVLLCPLEDDAELSEERFVSFLTSYGDQLIAAWIDLDRLRSSSCRRIARKCRNLQAQVACGVKHFKRLAALNKRVHNVYFSLEVVQDWSPLSATMQSIQSVSALTIDPNGSYPADASVPKEFIRNMFSPKLSSLYYLDIARFMPLRCLSHITESTSRLEDIRLIFPTLENLDLILLVQANPLLKRAFIGEGTKVEHDEMIAVETATDLVSTLASAQKMETIEIRFFYRLDRSIVRDLLSPFRRKPKLKIRISSKSDRK